MKKKSIIYSDLSKKQLEILKELYIQKKVESMSHQELKKYVLELTFRFYKIKLFFLFVWYRLHLAINSSHPTYLFSLDLNYSFQVILFFASENLFLFQLRFYRQYI